MKIGSVTVQGSVRSRLEVWDWFQGDADNTYPYSGSILRLSFAGARKSLDWQFELAAPVLLGLPENAVAPGAQGALGLGANYFTANQRSRNAAMVFPKQGFLRFKGKAQSIRVGRFEFADGTEATPKNATLAAVKRDRIAQRLLGPFGFSHVGRSFDGFHYAHNTPATNFTVMGAIPTRGVFQVDGWGELHTGVLYASVTRPLGWKKNSAEWRVFGIYYQDWRHVLKTDNRALAARRGDMANLRIGSFGGHYLHTAETAAGALDLSFWGVLQTGKWGVLDHRAGAVSAEGGWQPHVLPKLHPWFRGGYFYGSGDNNPQDNRHGTFFQILPTARPFARFPFFDLINNRDILAIVNLKPHKALNLRSEFHSLRLSERNDLWYQGGGAFQPWTFGYVGRPVNGARSLANLYDLSADYQVNPNVTLGGYFGYAHGKAVMERIYPQGKDGRFGYVELLYRF